LKIDSLDYLVLTVDNMEKTCEFYQKALGMEIHRFDEGRNALKFGIQKINLHQKGNEFDPKALHPMAGSEDLCFITSEKIAEAITHLQLGNISIEEVPSSEQVQWGL